MSHTYAEDAMAQVVPVWAGVADTLTKLNDNLDKLNTNLQELTSAINTQGAQITQQLSVIASRV